MPWKAIRIVLPIAAIFASASIVMALVMGRNASDPPRFEITDPRENVSGHDSWIKSTNSYGHIELWVPITPGALEIREVSLQWGHGSRPGLADMSLTSEPKDLSQVQRTYVYGGREHSTLPEGGMRDTFQVRYRIFNFPVTIDRRNYAGHNLQPTEVIAFEATCVGGWPPMARTRSPRYYFETRPRVKVAVFRSGYLDHREAFENHANIVKDRFLANLIAFPDISNRVSFEAFWDPDIGASALPKMAVPVGADESRNLIGNFVQMRKWIGQARFDVMLMLYWWQNEQSLRGTAFTKSILARRGISMDVGLSDFRCSFPSDPITDEEFAELWEADPRAAFVPTWNQTSSTIGEVGAHELAHAFASVEDEYTSGSPKDCHGLSPRVLPVQPLPPNLVALTDDESHRRESYWPWAGAIPQNVTDPAGTTEIGGHVGGAYLGDELIAHTDRKWYRSESYCLMSLTQTAFCHACKQALVFMIRHRLGRQSWDVGRNYHYPHFPSEGAEM